MVSKYKEKSKIPGEVKEQKTENTQSISNF